MLAPAPIIPTDMVSLLIVWLSVVGGFADRCNIGVQEKNNTVLNRAPLINLFSTTVVFCGCGKVLVFRNQVGDMFTCENVGVFRRPFWALTAWNTLDFGVVIRIEKEWYGIPLFVRPVYDTVCCCLVNIVGPSGHKLANIDYKGSWNRRGGYPASIE